MSSLPTIAILATGGTIAGSADDSASAARYRAGAVPIDQLLAASKLGLERIANVRAASPALQRGLQVDLELSGHRAAFYRVYQHAGRQQLALVLLNKGDTPEAFAIDRMLQAGRWRSALDGNDIDVTAGGSLRSEVPAHGVQVYLLDAPVSEPALLAALDLAMKGARRKR